MMSIRDDAEGGVNSLIEDQAKEPGQCTLMVTQFDDTHDRVFGPDDIAKFQKFHLNPRGSTAMLDAIGQAIFSTDSYVDNMAVADRPGKVVFVVSTDGQENASTKYTYEMIRGMITERKEKYDWEFIFLAANQDAAMSGEKMGVSHNTTYAGTGASTNSVYSSTSSAIRSFRQGKGMNVAASVADDGTVVWDSSTTDAVAPLLPDPGLTEKKPAKSTSRKKKAT